MAEIGLVACAQVARQVELAALAHAVSSQVG